MERSACKKENMLCECERKSINNKTSRRKSAHHVPTLALAAVVAPSSRSVRPGVFVSE